jgi:hypothetical protein
MKIFQVGQTYLSGGAKLSKYPSGLAGLSKYPRGGPKLSKYPPGGAKLPKYPPGGAEISNIVQFGEACQNIVQMVQSYRNIFHMWQAYQIIIQVMKGYRNINPCMILSVRKCHSSQCLHTKANVIQSRENGITNSETDIALQLTEILPSRNWKLGTVRPRVRHVTPCHAHQIYSGDINAARVFMI